MPWPKEHKRETRERIVETAAAAFRREGTADALRTFGARGGPHARRVYTHFQSKDDLLADAVSRTRWRTRART